jgi:hypothetical protein
VGAKELYRAYQQVGLDLAEFEGSRYQRLAHIKRLLEDGLLDADLRSSRGPKNSPSLSR